MLVLALLAIAGGGPAPRGAYAEVAAASQAGRAVGVARVTSAVAAPSLAPERTVAVVLPHARAEVSRARLYLVHSSLLL